MIKFYCDRCGKDITDKPSNPSSIILTIETRGCESKTQYKEIC